MAKYFMKDASFTLKNKKGEVFGIHLSCTFDNVNAFNDKNILQMLVSELTCHKMVQIFRESYRP